MSKIKSKLVPMTPHEIFKMQVKGTYDNLRAEEGKDYIPPQLGGPYGQRETIEQGAVLNVVDFEGDE